MRQRRQPGGQHQRRRRMPPGPADTAGSEAARPAPAPRTLLGEMTPAERRDWFTEQRAELEDFCSYAQAWTKGRAGCNIHTGNDERYEQFLSKAADLIAGLEELRQQAAAEAAAQEDMSV